MIQIHHPRPRMQIFQNGTFGVHTMNNTMNIFYNVYMIIFAVHLSFKTKSPLSFIIGFFHIRVLMFLIAHYHSHPGMVCHSYRPDMFHGCDIFIYTVAIGCISGSKILKYLSYMIGQQYGLN